jgi:hypothetical protein
MEERMDIQLRANYYVMEREEAEEWLTEGMEQEEIEALMATEREEEAESAEPLDWESLPDWLIEVMDKPSEDVPQSEQIHFGEGTKYTQTEVTEAFIPEQSQEVGSTMSSGEPEGEEEKGKKRRGRTEIAAKLAEYEQKYPEKPSQRQLAEELGIPRTTLQHWLKRKGSIDADPEVIAFFESPAGAAFLHRLVLGAHFVFTLMGPCGIRLVCRYLELTGLNQFVAASYSPHQRVSVEMEEAVVEFGQEERKRLGEGMGAKQIAVCEDETYHPETCLVAIEPVSNFIVLEKYAENRQAKTWSKAIEEATTELSVEIIQSASDEGRGIVKHVEKGLGAHHAPDLFHVQNELVKGPGVALAGQKRRADKAANKATEKLDRYQEKKAAYLNDEGRTECPPGLEKKIEQAQREQDEAREPLETAAAHQERVKQAIRGISQSYHPYDLQTGKVRKAEMVSTSLEKHFSEIEAVSTEAGLSERCFKRIKKAKRVLVDMIATIAFFFMTVKAKVEALSLAPTVEQAVYDNLIPAIYLHLVAQKVKNAEEKYDFQWRSEQLLTPLLARDGPFRGLEKEELELIEKVATECAQLFQRSSSCVEGRNGQLALFHHSLHRLSNRKLAALTTVHNYFVERPDGTTAAERFFDAKPKDLFEWVLERVDLPGRPAQKRSQPQQKTYLAQPAA